jgi:uncharacterized protein (TIGR03085 family)
VNLDQRERDELLDLFLELGPAAPTLCEGWDTLDLAAHLWIREHQPTAAVGILVPRFADRTERMQTKAADRGLEWLVSSLRTPPLLPWRVPGVRNVTNLNEYVIHHEDVRRANGLGPRSGIDDVQDAIWKLVRGGAKLSARKLGGVGLSIARPGAEPVPVRKRDAVATITGEPVELGLYLAGRKAAAAVELSGPDDAVAAVRDAPFGI